MPRKVEVVEMPEALSASEACENINNVPKRQWRKWNQQSRFIFNDVFCQMGKQKSITHPKQSDMPDDQWETIKWNAAWIAADSARYAVKDAEDATLIMPLYRDCLKKLYAMAWIDTPESFDPEKEANRLANCLINKAMGFPAYPSGRVVMSPSVTTTKITKALKDHPNAIANIKQPLP